VILDTKCTAKIFRCGAPYDNRFISVITIENRKSFIERLQGLFGCMEPLNGSS